jgi:hypothetical protein
VSESALVRPDAVVAADRWEPQRCAQNKRVVDVNHARRQVRYFCERCRTSHIIEVGMPYTRDSA